MVNTCGPIESCEEYPVAVRGAMRIAEDIFPYGGKWDRMHMVYQEVNRLVEAV